MNIETPLYGSVRFSSAIHKRHLISCQNMHHNLISTPYYVEHKCSVAKLHDNTANGIQYKARLRRKTRRKSTWNVRHDVSISSVVIVESFIFSERVKLSEKMLLFVRLKSEGCQLRMKLIQLRSYTMVFWIVNNIKLKRFPKNLSKLRDHRMHGRKLLRGLATCPLINKLKDNITEHSFYSGSNCWYQRL